MILFGATTLWLDD